MRTREDKGALNLSQHLSEVSASLPPLLSEGLGEATLRDILTELEKPGRDPRVGGELLGLQGVREGTESLVVGPPGTKPLGAPAPGGCGPPGPGRAGG